MEYMVHLVGKNDVRVDPKNIEAMQYWPHPKTLKKIPPLLLKDSSSRMFLRDGSTI